MIPIVFSTDHNYVMQCGVAILSLLISGKETTYDIHVLISPDVTDEDKKKLRNQVEQFPLSTIKFMEMGNQFDGGYEVRGISKACYYRLMIPWLLPKIDKIIYCDVDIIFKASLQPLFDIEMGDKLVAGAFSSTSEGFLAIKKYLTKLGLDYKKYINSGVLLINSKAQREKELNKEYERLATQKFLYQDQDIINIACKGEIIQFDRRFNLQPKVFATSEDLQENVVIHYAGDKPWNNFTYAWAEWWEIYNRSVFRDNEMYNAVSGKILSLKHRLLDLKRKATFKLNIMISKYLP